MFSSAMINSGWHGNGQIWILFYPLPNCIILVVTILKAFLDDRWNVAKMINCLFDRVENTLGKGENAGDKHFLLFPQCFPKFSSSGLFKVVKG